MRFFDDFQRKIELEHNIYKMQPVWEEDRQVSEVLELRRRALDGSNSRSSGSQQNFTFLSTGSRRWQAEVELLKSHSERHQRESHFRQQIPPRQAGKERIFVDTRQKVFRLKFKPFTVCN